MSDETHREFPMLSDFAIREAFIKDYNVFLTGPRLPMDMMLVDNIKILIIKHLNELAKEE